MKYPLCYTLLFLCLLCCQSEPKLTIEDRYLTVPSCSECAKIKVQVPKVLGETKLARNVNTAVEEELIYALRFDEEDVIATVEAAVVSFNTSYKKMVREFGEFSEPWEATIQGSVTFESKAMLTIALTSEMHTGGAHGHYAKTFLNFDAGSAKELEHFELFGDLEGFVKIAERYFRKAYDIPKEENINATGFMFPKDIFKLPLSLGFTKTGIELYYGLYEVASYADGPLVITIPYKVANPYLNEVYAVPK